ncbi:MAG: hypothetical protein J7L14_01260 [Candidatus Diapherotrites archaeon]|nr:hypothetical protein [Candidatus Diapherotrites archaeon]
MYTINSAFILTEMVADFSLVLKIFLLMTIISFVKNHIGMGKLGIVITVVISWFVLFDYWKFFGGIFVFYLLLAFGTSSLLIDFFFVMPVRHTSADQLIPGKESPRWQSPVNTGVDIAKRLARRR